MRILFLFLLLSMSVHSEVTLKIQTNKALLAIDILDNISRFSKHHPKFFTYWRDRVGLTLEDTDNFLRYVAIRSRYCSKTEGINSIRTNRSGLFVLSEGEYRDLILTTFQSSHNVDEALHRLQGHINGTDLDTLGQIFAYYADEIDLIENRFNEYAVHEVATLQKELGNLHGLDAYFSDIMHFYGVHDTIEIPLILTWWPRTRKDNRGSAFMSGKALVVRLNDSRRSLSSEELIGVIMHELVHRIEMHMSDSLKRFCTDVFIAEASKDYQILADVPPKVIYEPLAVALGQMVFTKRFYPRDFDVEKTIWYANPWIDSFAKELYPLVERYLSEGKSIDAPFMETVARQYVFHRLNKFW